MRTGLEAILSASASDGHLYRPEILRLSVASDRERWLLLLEEPGIRVFDTLGSQLAELVRSRNPSVRFNPVDLKAAAVAHLQGADPVEYGAWVWYAWSRRLVHVLDEAEFAAVRTDRNRNKITREEQAKLAQWKVGVIGLSVGQSVALTIALERGFGELRIADLDTLDLSNLNRIRSGVHHLGLNKCVNVAREIAEIDPFLKVTCFPEGLNADNLDRFFTEGGPLDVLVEECDAVDIKILARQKARELRIPVVMDTSDRGMLDVERFDLEPDRPLLHGMIAHLDPADAAKARTNEEKMPFLAPMVGLDGLSPRMKASLLELGQTVGTWPQLATNVVLGGALAADAVRRIALGTFSASGRWYVDMDRIISDDQRAPDPELYRGLSPAHAEPLDITAMAERAARVSASATGALAMNARQARWLATAGALAPSAGNMQPWKFLLHEGRLFLFHERSRSVSKLDPGEMIPLIALGACLENMTLAAADLGLSVTTELYAGDGDPLVAMIALDGRASETEDRKDLASQIAIRHSNRRKADGRPIAAKDLLTLSESVNDGIALLHLLTDTESIGTIATIAGAAERIRVLNPYGHLEFFHHEVRWTREEVTRSNDGLDVDTLEFSMSARTALRAAADPEAMIIVRRLKGGKGFERLSYETISGSPAVALVSVPDDRVNTLLQGGRAAQRFWLTASALGLSVHPISAAIFLGHAAGNVNADAYDDDERWELQGLYHRLHEVFRLTGRQPLFMVRLSHSDAATARSLRLPLDQLFHTTQPIRS